MAKIFKEQSEVNNRPNRNNFDLSFQNHMTMKMGTLYPFFCKPVVPTDQFRIKTALGLKFMPLVFPVQSKMKAYVHYFYVRNKNIWKNWYNFLQGLEEHTHPYIDQPNKFFKTGTLSDYLGVPTTVEDVNELYRGMQIVQNPSEIPQPLRHSFTQPYVRSIQYINGVPVETYTIGDRSVESNPNPLTTSFGWKFDTGTDPIRLSREDGNVWLYLRADFFTDVIEPLVNAGINSSSGFTGQILFPSDVVDGAMVSMARFNTNDYYVYRNEREIEDETYVGVRIYKSDNPVTENLTLDDIFARTGEFSIIFEYAINTQIYDENENAYIPWDRYEMYIGSDPETAGGLGGMFVAYFYGTASFNKDAGDISPDGNAFKSMHINALPYRAYESIYNAYYRNTQNQPFYIDGVAQFNKYNTTLEDGADKTNYHLFQRNYELDFLTSAMPSPQQGAAPLVGLVQADGSVSIEDENGVVTNATLDYTSDGQTLTGKVSIHNPAASTENNRTLSRAAMAAAGMSINDLRGVGALQRWLETNMRKGYKYKDFIDGHFDKSPKYEELDMPEFIGGFSEDVVVSQVTQTSESTPSKPLGSYAAQANAFGSSRDITHYCDDYGYIIGIICVVPTPSYSQLLPKHFTAYDKLDYYFPEFAQLGMQPIPYKEVAPLQTIFSGDADLALNDTFGYQRPNYDLIASVDEVHGQFRLTLRNFLISRLFKHRPELGDEFLKINPDDAAQIFAYDAPDEDNIIGQIVVDCVAKRPIPRIHVPSLNC